MKITYTLSQLDDVATQIIAHSKSTILLFYGDMGVGKTTLIKALCSALNVQSPVKSPTFSLVNEYVTTKDELVYHFDFYRIKEEVEVLDIGFDQYLDAGSWIFIEWPDRIGSFLPNIRQEVHIYRLTENKRILEIKNNC